MSAEQTTASESSDVLVSHYCVVRWLPDVTAGEFVNVGVVAFGQGKSLVRLLNDWTRARAFDPNLPSPEWFADYAAEVAATESIERLRRRTEGMGHAMSSCQLYGPYVGLAPVEELLSGIARIFLVEQKS